MAELKKEDETFHNKEAIEAEVRRRVEAELKEQEEVERQKSIERRKRIVIIREDLQKKQAEEDRKMMEMELAELERQQREKANREEMRDSQEVRQSKQSLSAWQDDQSAQHPFANELTVGGRQEMEGQMRRSIDLKKKRNDSIPDESAISEAGLSQHLGPRDMQNPQGESQGEDEELKGEIIDFI